MISAPDKRDFTLHGTLFPVTTPRAIPVTYKIGDKLYIGMPCDSHIVIKEENGVTNTEYTANTNGITVKCVLTSYKSYPVTEWIVYLTNNTDKSSERVSGFYPINTVIRGNEPDFEYSNGDSCTPEGYEIFHSDLNSVVTLKAADGTPCCGAFPYMRLNYPEYGVNIAVGFTANWRAEINRADGGVSFTAGQDVFDTVILPGETMISPRITVMSYYGGSLRGGNMWRRWYYDYIVPDCGGEKIKPMLSLHNYGKGPESTCATEESQITAIDSYVSHGLKPDFWWLDAGWYPCNHVWQKTGTWFENKQNFPRGLAPVGEHCDSLGIKFLLWFEPERVSKGSWLDRRHPEWILKRQDSEGLFGLLDLGNPDALNWAIEHFDAFIKRCHIRIYRQDFNMAPVNNWRENETPDRRGALENRHVQGYYRFWDELRRRNPGLLIDSCASGGRRNDLETMRRAVAFHYTDVGYGILPVKQKQHRLMHEWIPYFRSHTHSWDDERGEYSVRRKSIIDEFNYQNNMSPAVTNLLPYDASDAEFALAVKMEKIHQRAGGYMLGGDYYPLTECSRSNRDYYALQFAKDKDGYYQIIANTKADGSFTLRLHALLPEAVYVSENALTGECAEHTGAELMNGIAFNLKPRSGELWFYKEKDKA